MFAEHMALHRMDCLSSNRNLTAYHFIERFLEETPAEQFRPAKLVTGNDVLRLGVRSGPLVGRLLAAVEEAQLNGEISTREEAIVLVGDKLRELSSERR